MEEILIVIIVFGTIFGIFYLFVTAKHRERMALIENGINADILKQSESKRTVWKSILVTLAFLLMGVGLGIFIGNVAHMYLALPEEVAYPGTIFTMAGLGLFTGYKQASKENKSN